MINSITLPYIHTKTTNRNTYTSTTKNSKPNTTNNKQTISNITTQLYTKTRQPVHKKTNHFETNHSTNI